MTDAAAALAPIGVFDSGVGGLSVLQALRARLPNERFVYVADSGHAPYGDRAPEFVENRARQVASFLVRQQAKALVIACNTASVLVAAGLRELHSIPIVAMEPAIKPAASSTRSKVVLVLATTGTLRSRAVAQLCSAYGEGVRLILQACPGLADQVERGEFGSAATRRLLHAYIGPGIANGADTIVLGCTHYAFLRSEIASIAGPAVTLVEPSEAIARQLARVLVLMPAAASPNDLATDFYTSGSVAFMSSFLAKIGEPFERIFPLSAGPQRATIEI